MIDQYRGLAVFVAVAQAGSFSAAGRVLKLSTSVVSHHIAKLEAGLGTPLFFRTTRSLSLTREGTQILDAATRMVTAGQEALDALSVVSDQPVGGLRITLPAFGNRSPVHRRIWEFARAYPLVHLSVHASDRQVDLVKDGYDIAIRLGELADSALKTRRIGRFERVLAAAPAYLATHGPIRDLDDLAKATFINYAMLPPVLTLTDGAETVTVTPTHSQIEVDSITAGRGAVLSGLGIQNLPLSEVEADLAHGTLVEVLPKWRLPALGVFAVWPGSGPQKQLTRRFIDYLVD
ncbi:MAG: LysR family transcriptional regulator [Pseudomonadota bacterium]